MNTIKKYRRAAATLLSSATLLIFLSGCERVEDAGLLSAGARKIAFTASVGKMETAVDGTKSSMSGSRQCGTIMLTSADGSISVPVAVFETEGVAVPETKGRLINGPLNPGMPGDDAPIPLKDSIDRFVASAYNTDDLAKLFSPELVTVRWDGSRWRTADTYYWPQTTGLDIYAYANMPASEYAEIAIDEAARTQTLTYTVPRDAKDQKDILMAMYSGTGDNEGRAELLFYHPLTAVQFSRDESMAEASGITEIIMAGVNHGGSVTQDMSSPATFLWDVEDKEHTVSQDNDGKPFELNGKIDGDPFLLVPQLTTATRTVSLTVSLVYNGHVVPLNAILVDMDWRAGRTYTYVVGYNGNLEVSLDLQEVSSTEKGSATIANVGTKKCYVRAIVDGLVIDVDGYVKRTYLGNEGDAEGIGAFTAESGTFGTETWNTDWVMGNDGFYYYRLPLEVDNAGHTNPASKTTPLFNSYVFDGLSAYEYYEMNISTQAIEWDASKSYVKEFWGEAAANLLQ